MIIPKASKILFTLKIFKELKTEAKREDSRLEEISAKEVQLNQRSKELQNEERHLLQRLDEISIFENL